MVLHIQKVAMVITARISMEKLQSRLPASVDRFGEILAQQIIQCEQEQNLGYYPALDYFKVQPGIDPYLLDAADQIAEAAIQLCQQEVMAALSPVFSNVRLISPKLLAFGLPPVRPGDAPEALARHYTPDTLKFEIQLSIIQKNGKAEGVEKGARNIVQRWLAERFEQISISSERVLQ